MSDDVKMIMAKNIMYHMKRMNISRYELCDALGFKYTTLSQWLQGKKYPRIDKIEAMAEYFGITKADLVEDCSLEQSDIYFYRNAANALARDLTFTEKLQVLLNEDEALKNFTFSDSQLLDILRYARFIAQSDTFPDKPQIK